MFDWSVPERPHQAILVPQHSEHSRLAVALRYPQAEQVGPQAVAQSILMVELAGRMAKVAYRMLEERVLVRSQQPITQGLAREVVAQGVMLRARTQTPATQASLLGSAA